MGINKSKVAEEVESLAQSHGWTVESGGGLPLTVVAPDGDQKITVHGTPTNPDAIVTLLEGEYQEKWADIDAVKKRVRLWMENHN